MAGKPVKCVGYPQPKQDHKLLLAQLVWELPPPSPPRITQNGQLLPN
jgi:hypothetical protein